MALLDLWHNDRTQLMEKHVQQVIAFAGDGKLRDNSPASSEFRDYLRHIPSTILSRYADDCLQTSFSESGLALQDIVNEIGHRLDFQVVPGRYRGTSQQPGHDGIWVDTNSHSIVIEVKTTDAYRIDLNTIARYRKELVNNGTLSLANSSMLVIVGRQDTGDLEAQIRGSHYAWDMRVISVDALLRMLNLKEEVEDPSLLTRIHDILIPHEFTRLDPIIEIAFAAVSDVKLGTGQEEGKIERTHEGKKFTPVAFHDDCISTIEKKFGTSLVKKSRSTYSTADDSARVTCLVSKYHEREKRYWFAFHPHQYDYLDKTDKSYVAFGCGNSDVLFLIPFSYFKNWLNNFYKTESPDRSYWHVVIRKRGNYHFITGKSGTKNIDIEEYKF